MFFFNLSLASVKVLESVKMRLESLANELLVGIYECLPDVRLLRAFYGLNERFDII